MVKNILHQRVQFENHNWWLSNYNPGKQKTPKTQEHSELTCQKNSPGRRVFNVMTEWWTVYACVCACKKKNRTPETWRDDMQNQQALDTRSSMEWQSDEQFVFVCAQKNKKQDTWNMKGWHAKPKSPGYQVLNEMTELWTVCVCVHKKTGHLKHEGMTCQAKKPWIPGLEWNDRVMDRLCLCA